MVRGVLEGILNCLLLFFKVGDGKYSKILKFKILILLVIKIC